MLPEPPRAILFDWDNTLVDSWVTIHHALSKTFEDMGREPWNMEEVKLNIRHSLRDSFPALFGNDWEKAADLYRSHFHSCHLGMLSPIEGAKETLTLLSEQDIPLCILSNKTGKFLREEVEALGWQPYFHRVVGATDAAHDKPATDPVHMALEGSGVEAGETVWIIGDSVIDIECAQNAGCLAVFYGENPGPASLEYIDEQTLSRHSDHTTLSEWLGQVFSQNSSALKTQEA